MDTQRIQSHPKYYFLELTNHCHFIPHNAAPREKGKAFREGVGHEGRVSNSGYAAPHRVVSDRSRGIGPEVRKVRGLRRYGGDNHSIGMATHDPMGTFAGPDETLKPGFVFACDINLIHPDREMDVRMEDTVLITEKGVEILSACLPRPVDEKERMVRGK